MTGHVLQRAWREAVAALPRGHGLPARDWERRHRGMMFVLWAHAAGIFLFVLLRQQDLLHAVEEGGAVAIAGLLATWPGANRRWREIFACIGLLTSSAILVHLSGGYIEMHFHFFVMVPLMALYQDWVPFLTAIGYVVLHHGTVGVLDASQVYNHAAAWASPWTWAAIHGVFVLGASIVSCISWRLNELAAADAAASAQRFGDLVQSLDAVVWEADPDMERFTFMSRQAEAVFGIAPSRWQTEPGLWRRLLHPEDKSRTLTAYDACILEGGDNQFAYRFVVDGGRVVHVSEVVHVVRDDSGAATQLRGVTVDTTARLALEEQLRQSQKLEAIGRLAGGIAHDFNNLLSVIIGRAEMISSDEPTVRRPVALISSTAQRAAGLTRQLLAFGRQQVMQPRVIDLGEVVRGLAPMLRRVVREDIELLIEPGQAGHVTADPVQVEQVVLNLIVNASDAMPNGGRLTLDISDVELDGHHDGRRIGAPAGRYVALRVADTGVGMNPATLEHIFEPFYTTKDVGKGTGLGLATVYGIVTQSNGDIRVDSAEGHGSRFTVYLPRVDAPLSPRARPVAPERRSAPSETVLVVEDEPDVRALMRDVLREAGYLVVVAGGPAEALQLAESTPGSIDLLITDIVMPGMNGVVLSERITAARPATKVLYMTGYSHDAVMGLGAVGTYALLQKPFTPSDLSARVREALEGVTG